MRRLFAVAFVACLAVAPAFAQGGYKIESAQGLPSGDVTAAVKGSLQSQGIKYLDTGGKELAEVWFVKQLPAAQNPQTSPNILYSKIAAGSLVGVIQFPSGTTDYRGQDIKAGYYTMRYQLIPENGNHMGVSQYRDFLLLVPASQDSDASKALSFDQTVQLSRKATSTGHPAVLMMDGPSDSDQKFPAAFQDYSQNWAVQAKVPLSGGSDLPIAFVLVGKYEG